MVAATAASPQLDAQSYMLMDAQTGTVLAEKNADIRLPPASLTKIMTTYLVFQALQDGRLSPQQQVTISENAWGSRVVGSKMFVEVGKQVSIADLLRGVIVQSGNDASIALAEALAGDESAFAAIMQETATAMGLRNTSFVNATGLPSPQQYTSARDMAIISRRLILDFPQWYTLYSEPEFTYNGIRQPNRNRLLSEFPGADGIKTGYTKEAGYCLAASVQRRGQRLISVVMKAPSARTRVKESKKLLTYGFNQFHNVTLFTTADTRTRPTMASDYRHPDYRASRRCDLYAETIATVKCGL